MCITWTSRAVYASTANQVWCKTIGTYIILVGSELLLTWKTYDVWLYCLSLGTYDLFRANKTRRSIASSCFWLSAMYYRAYSTCRGAISIAAVAFSGFYYHLIMTTILYKNTGADMKTSKAKGHQSYQQKMIFHGNADCARRSSCQKQKAARKRCASAEPRHNGMEHSIQKWYVHDS